MTIFSLPKNKAGHFRSNQQRILFAASNQILLIICCTGIKNKFLFKFGGILFLQKPFITLTILMDTFPMRAIVIPLAMTIVHRRYPLHATLPLQTEQQQQQHNIAKSQQMHACWIVWPDKPFPPRGTLVLINHWRRRHALPVVLRNTGASGNDVSDRVCISGHNRNRLNQIYPESGENGLSVVLPPVVIGVKEFFKPLNKLEIVLKSALH